jgi:CheY-like chemotaxis protein
LPQPSKFLDDEFTKRIGKDKEHAIVPISEATESQHSSSDSAEPLEPDTPLPDQLSVLFVDDDFILRKLFGRSIKRCCPSWNVSEAASGEAALELISNRGSAKPFDLIFLDQYMASAEKQLLGTETVRLIRSKGVESIICGLSANNIEWQFREAGADCFIMKPLPCEASDLVHELKRVLGSTRYRKDDHV